MTARNWGIIPRGHATPPGDQQRKPNSSLAISFGSPSHQTILLDGSHDPLCEPVLSSDREIAASVFVGFCIALPLLLTALCVVGIYWFG